MKKVLFLDTSLFVGGAEKYLADYIGQLQKIESNKIDFFIVCPDIFRYKLPEKTLMIKVGSLRKGFFIVNWIKFLLTIFKLLFFLFKNKIDVIVSNTARGHMLCYILNKIFGIKYIPIFHEVFLGEKWFRKISDSADRIVFITDFVQKYYTLGDINDKYCILRNSVPFDIFSHDIKYEDEKILEFVKFKGQNKVIGMCAFFYKWKGQKEFVDLAIELLKFDNSLKFVIIGGAKNEDSGSVQYFDEVNQYILDNQLNQKITITGNVENIIPFMNLCDLIIHNSLQPEPFGRVILEGIVLGKPVLASEGGGVNEILPKQYRFNPYDKDGRVKVIFDILKDPTIYKVNIDKDLYDLSKNTLKLIEILN